MKEFISKNVGQTKKIAALLAKGLPKGSFLALVGELGSGKTVFVKGLAEGLGLKNGVVNSPTFVLIKEYEGKKKLYHFDLYRLKTEKEVEELGAQEYFFGDGIVAMEWADKAPAILPKEHIRIEFSVLDDDKRKIRFIPFGARYKKIIQNLKFLPKMEILNQY